jgi:hypothetical protein
MKLDYRLQTIIFVEQSLIKLVISQASEKISRHFSPVISISKPTNFRNGRPQYLVVGHLFKRTALITYVGNSF